jgi:hypothetical protein
MPFAEADGLPQPMGHNQDVGKQDRGIEGEAADRLQADLDRELRIEAQFEDAAGRGPAWRASRQRRQARSRRVIPMAAPKQDPTLRRHI